MEQFSLRSHTYDGRYLELSCLQEQVVAENKSVIHWTLTVAGGNANYYTTGPTTVKIDGQTVYYAPTAYWNAYQFPAARGSVSGTLELSHREDGTRSVECSLQTSIYTGVLKTAEGQWELDSIARASTLMAADCYIGSACMVVVDRKNSQYTHTIALCAPDLEGFLGADGQLNQEPVQLDATTVSFQVPEHLYNRIPNDKRLLCTLVCSTYLGEVQIGEDTYCSFYALCREEDCLPGVGGEVEDINPATCALVDIQSKLVRYFSTVGCDIFAQGKKGASIVSRQVNGIPMEGDHLEIPNVETGTFVFQATDSRGYRQERVLQLELVPYCKLTAKASYRRQAPTSDRVELTVTGDWWEGSFGAVENTLEVTCRVGQQELVMPVSLGEKGYTATLILEDMAYDSANFLFVTVKDQLMTLQLPVTVNPGVPVFDWGQRDFAFHVPVTLSDGAAAVSESRLRQLLTDWGLL